MQNQRPKETYQYFLDQQNFTRLLMQQIHKLAMTRTMCHPLNGESIDSCSSRNNKEILIGLLQDSIEYVEEERHHPVLYETLSALHEYIRHQQNLLIKNAAKLQEMSVDRSSKKEFEIPKNDTSITSSHTDVVKDNKYLGSTSEDYLVEQSVEVGVDEFINEHDVHDTIEGLDENDDDDDLCMDKVSDDETINRASSQDEVQATPSHKDKEVKGESHFQSESVAPEKKPRESQSQATLSKEKLLAEAKVRALDKSLPKRVLPELHGKQTMHVSPTEAQMAQINAASPANLVELQKKFAAEQRRKDLDLQRKLARTDQRRKDLQNKLKFLHQEQKKQELVTKVAAQRSSGSDSHKTALENVRQIKQNMATTEAEMKEKLAEVAQLVAEIDERKRNPPKPNFTFAQSANLVQQRRMSEQARKEKVLEEQKKAAAEKQRREFEAKRVKAREEQRKREEAKKRRFLEQDQRKQNLIAKAKEGGGKGNAGDSILLKKLSKEMGQLDAEVEDRKCAEDAKRAEDADDGLAEEAQSPPQTVRKTPIEEPKLYEGLYPNSPDPQNEYQGTSRASPPTPSDHQNHSRQQPISPPQSWDSPHNPASYSYSARRHHHRQQQQTEPEQQPKSEGNQKYSQMAEQTDDNDEACFTELKRNIIVNWALQPPNMVSLRPIDQLLRTIQDVYPPANGVPAHSYFDGWKPITDKDLLNAAGVIDEKKLIKSVRKLRFFLHPDKLPHDLIEEHHFAVKLLWDITNDAWEDYEKAQDELDWMN